MSHKYEGKHLLMLGSNTGAVDIVTYAREQGARVSVADYLDESKSPAKRVADYAVRISTADVDKLVDYARANNVDGVFAGVGGFNLQKAMEVSKCLGLRSYFDRKQWDAIETKHGFRRMCEKFGVPCPSTYFVGHETGDIPWDIIQYPAVIKPVDSKASQGVYICDNKNELEDRFPSSLDLSPSGEVIIEEFCKGHEFTAHYVVHKGKAHLVCMDNRYPVAVHDGSVTTIPVARIYPSRFLDPYINSVDPGMVALLESMGFDTAVVFVQGLYDEEKDAFSLFEAGMRSAAEMPNRFLVSVTGNDYIHMLVDYTLNGESDYLDDADDPMLNGHCCGIVSFVARGATVGEIRGLDEAVKNTQSVLQYESRYPVGTTTPDGDTLRQLMIRFVMDCDSREQMAQDVAYLNEHISVLDEYGSNMVKKFDPERLWDIV